MDPHAQFGSIDVYLFDQILRGRFEGRRRILDLGCGGGRNLRWFLRQGLEVHGLEVHGLDADPQAVEASRQEAAEHGGAEAASRIVQGEAAQQPYPDAHFDALIVNAVLHFVADEAQFDAIVGECARVLAPGGLFFARLCSSIGMEGRAMPRGPGAPGLGRHLLPDGSERFLVDRAKLAEATRRLGGQLADPVKTTLVEDLRAMTTWVVVRDGAGPTGTTPR